MNPYQAPKTPLTDEVVRSGDSWLSLRLRRAFLFPPLLAAPALGIAVLVFDSSPPTHPASLIALTGAAYVVQFTYGALCYFVLNRLRWLNLPAIVAASQLPILFGALALDWHSVAAYSLSALAVALASAYFVVTPRAR